MSRRSGCLSQYPSPPPVLSLSLSLSPPPESGQPRPEGQRVGPGALPPAGRQRGRQGHVGPGHREEHALRGGGAADGQRLRPAQAGGKLESTGLPADGGEGEAETTTKQGVTGESRGERKVESMSTNSGGALDWGGGSVFSRACDRHTAVLHAVDSSSVSRGRPVSLLGNVDPFLSSRALLW